MKQSKEIFNKIDSVVADPEFLAIGKGQLALSSMTMFAGLALILMTSSSGHADVIPGDDISGKMEAAGSLLRLLDTVMFSWGARLCCGFALLYAGWNLKKLQIARMACAIVAAILFGYGPNIVKDIFSASGSSSVFSSNDLKQEYRPSNSGNGSSYV